MENLKIIDIIKGMSAERLFVDKRFSHALVLKISGESMYDFRGFRLSLKEGEALFVPKGSIYNVNRVSDKSEYLLINFDADINKPEPKIYSFYKYPELNFVYEHLAKMWLFHDQAGKYKCYSVFYDILSFILSKEKPEYRYTKKLNMIKNGMDYLQTYIFDCDLQVDDLHRVCNISNTYFRKIFIENFGTTPQKYIINKRMSRAGSIIASGEYSSITDVALSVGYNDVLYFSRIFSKKYGVCPSKYIQKFKK